MQAATNLNALDDEADKTITPEGWEKVPALLDLKQDLADAKNSHDTQVAKIKEWLDNLNITGSAVIPKVDGRSRVQPKLIRKQAEWRYASLSEPFLAADDLFDVQPVTFEDTEAARQNKLVLGNQFNTKIDKVAFVDNYVRAAVDEGTIIVKCSWETIEEEVTREGPNIVGYEINPEMAELYAELATQREADPTGYAHEVPEELRLALEASEESGQSLEPIVDGTKTITELKVVSNRPILEVCNSANVVIDPSCGSDHDNASFIVHSYETNKAKLRETGEYTNLDQINVEASSPLNEPDHADESDQTFNFKDDARKRLLAYDYWGFYDIRGTGKLYPIVATWVGDVLIRLAESPYPDKKLPFIFVPTLPVKDSVYGEPDGELLVDNQKIIGAITRGMIDVMARSANGQVGVRKDALDAVNRRKFQQGKDYEYNGAIDPRMAFHMGTYPEIPNSAQFMLQQQNSDAESMTGVKAFSSGINADSLGDVATGIRGAIDAAGKREMGILRRLASGMTKIARKIISMNSEFLEDEEIIRITNESFVAVRRDDLAGNFDLRMDISTLEEDNVKAQELAFMLQTMSSSADAAMVRIILRDIARLRKMPELAKEIENYQPQPDPAEEEIKQLTIAKLKAEIFEIEARAIEHQSDAGLNEAREGTEIAKARQLGSQSDKTDLDFVEQESGTTQERQKELQGEQAEANMRLESHKKGLEREDDNVTELAKYLKNK
jgi:hypothetical protein